MPDTDWEKQIQNSPVEPGWKKASTNRYASLPPPSARPPSVRVLLRRNSAERQNEADTRPIRKVRKAFNAPFPCG
eukprot:8551436-Prorocentrum_lima.AAC.1